MINIDGLTGRVILQGSPGYDEARQNYNGRFNKFPIAIVYCNVVQDVANAILWVRKHQLPFRIRCGGHSYEAFSNIDGGLVIDVSGLLTLEINKEELTMRIGAGHRLLPLYRAIWEQGVALPGGTCPGVGVSGLTLAGGYGLLARLFGLTCDNLLGVEMVTAQGKVIYANDNQNSDLLWACRGGGDGNFGVITSLTFRVHPIGNVSRYRMTWNFADLEKVMRFWQRWAPYANTRLTSLLAFPAQNQGDLRSSGVFVGNELELRQIIQPLLEATRPKTVEFHSSTWIEAAQQFTGSGLKQEKFKNSSAYCYEPLSYEALRVLIGYLQTAPGFANVISFDAGGGAIDLIPDGATAFSHRGALFSIQYHSYWSRDEEADINMQWIEQFRNAMLPYTRGANRNYVDSLIVDWPTAYFEENLARLMTVKQKYDPENFFRYEQSIPIYYE